MSNRIDIRDAGDAKIEEIQFSDSGYLEICGSSLLIRDDEAGAEIYLNGTEDIEFLILALRKSLELLP